MTCDCEDFEKGMKWIESCETLAWAHGYLCDRKLMRYCAWCGKLLKEEKINDEATLKEWKPKNKRKTKITKERLLELSNECQLGGKLIINGEEINETTSK